MPPQPTRFAVPPSISPYQHQFTNHPSQTHTAHQPSLATQGYMGNSQMSPFGAANGLGGLGAGLSTAGFAVSDHGLGSHTARMSFVQGGLQQQQQQQAHQQSHGLGGEHSTRPSGASKGRIRDVWKSNLLEELGMLRELVDEYPYVSMDTEFPGIVGRPMGNFLDKSDYHYQTLRTNVDMLKIIQVGIAIFNEKGETPPARPSDSNEVGPLVRKYLATHGSLPSAWQFNFHFDIKSDMANQSSIESLQSAGIDFEKLAKDGIDPASFAALMTTSGLVCYEDVKWLSFHGGYDFGYFTKCLMDQELPNDGARFDQLMKVWFPTTFDVKHLLKYALKLHYTGRLTPPDPAAVEILLKFEQKSGLEAAAEAFKVKRVGAAHQAGSDSLLTGKIFFTLREKIFGGYISDDQIGKIWGLAVGASMPNTFGVYTGPGPSSNDKENTPAATATNGGPSTPSTSSVGLATTPAAAQSHNTNGNGGNSLAPMTPGGGGGVFGSFFPGTR